MMSHSSTNLVFVQLVMSSCVQGTTGYKDKLFWPKQLDVKAKACTFPLGAELTVFLSLHEPCVGAAGAA